MTKLEKLIQKILDGQSIITIDEAEKILQKLEYVAEKAVGSHITYRKECREPVTLVLTTKELKPYMLKMLLYPCININAYPICVEATTYNALVECIMN